jgi:hypothetical protein
VKLFSKGVILSEAKDLLFARAENKADPSVARPTCANTAHVGDPAKPAQPQDDTYMGFSAA